MQIMSLARDATLAAGVLWAIHRITAAVERCTAQTTTAHERMVSDLGDILRDHDHRVAYLRGRVAGAEDDTSRLYINQDKLNPTC